MPRIDPVRMRYGGPSKYAKASAFAPNRPDNDASSSSLGFDRPHDTSYPSFGFDRRAAAGDDDDDRNIDLFVPTYGDSANGDDASGGGGNQTSDGDGGVSAEQYGDGDGNARAEQYGDGNVLAEQHGDGDGDGDARAERYNVFLLNFRILAGAILAAAAALYFAIWNFLAAILSAIWNFLAARVPGIRNFLAAILSGIWNFLAAPVPGIRNFLAAIPSGIWNFLAFVYLAVRRSLRAVVDDGHDRAMRDEYGEMRDGDVEANNMQFRREYPFRYFVWRIACFADRYLALIFFLAGAFLAAKAAAAVLYVCVGIPYHQVAPVTTSQVPVPVLMPPPFPKDDGAFRVQLEPYHTWFERSRVCPISFGYFAISDAENGIFCPVYLSDHDGVASLAETYGKDDEKAEHVRTDVSHDAEDAPGAAQGSIVVDVQGGGDESSTRRCWRRCCCRRCCCRRPLDWLRYDDETATADPDPSDDTSATGKHSKAIVVREGTGVSIHTYNSWWKTNYVRFGTDCTAGTADNCALAVMPTTAKYVDWDVFQGALEAAKVFYKVFVTALLREKPTTDDNSKAVIVRGSTGLALVEREKPATDKSSKAVSVRGSIDIHVRVETKKPATDNNSKAVSVRGSTDVIVLVEIKKPATEDNNKAVIVRESTGIPALVEREKPATNITNNSNNNSKAVIVRKSTSVLATEYSSYGGGWQFEYDPSWLRSLNRRISPFKLESTQPSEKPVSLYKCTTPSGLNSTGAEEPSSPPELGNSLRSLEKPAPSDQRAQPSNIDLVPGFVESLAPAPEPEKPAFSGPDSVPGLHKNLYGTGSDSDKSPSPMGKHGSNFGPSTTTWERTLFVSVVVASVVVPISVAVAHNYYFRA